MSELPVSVVIVSRGRPDALARCLLATSQVQYDPFEIIVVADTAGQSTAGQMAFADHLKILPFDEANISAARNLGLSHAAGEVVAFLDDDAVPEPQWLHHLVAPAARSDVAAMTGFVRGRNGISFQWKARTLDALGEPHDLTVDSRQTTILHPPPGRAVKTEGTNMAFRRTALIDLGGFDPAFHYFLDETDLNMRLACAGHATAVVPLAEVHHGFFANSVRNANRVPRDLFNIGASWAVFQRKHVPLHNHASQWHRLRDGERRRLIRHLVAGGLEPRDLRRLQASLEQGYAEGQKRSFGTPAISAHSASSFLRFPSLARTSMIMASRPLRLRRDLSDAAAKVNNGHIVTVINLSLTAMFHHVSFNKDGVWVQRGGLFGRSDRDQPLVQLTARQQRVRAETQRVAGPRGLKEPG